MQKMLGIVIIAIDGVIAEIPTRMPNLMEQLATSSDITRCPEMEIS